MTGRRRKPSPAGVIDVAFRNAALYLLAMIKANALKTGAVVAIDGAPCVLEHATVQTPSARGASATARPKPVTMPTGLVVNVPEYLSAGETIRIDTRTGEFLGRA